MCVSVCGGGGVWGGCGGYPLNLGLKDPSEIPSDVAISMYGLIIKVVPLKLFPNSIESLRDHSELKTPASERELDEVSLGK